jgi:flagellar biosynthesis protein FlhG
MKQTKKMGRGLEDFSHLFLSSPSEKPEKSDEKVKDAAEQEKSLSVPARTLCITSDKGVHERSFVAIQLALEISRRGRNIVLFDADFRLPRLGMLIDDSIEQNSLMHLMESNGQEKHTVRDYKGITLITVDADLSTCHSLSPRQLSVLENNFNVLEEKADVILIVISPEMTDLMKTFLKGVSEIMVVVPQPVAKMINAYGVIKSVFNYNSTARVGVLASRVTSPSQAEAIFAKMQQVVEKFLHKSLCNYGYLDGDTELSLLLEQGKSPETGAISGKNSDLPSIASIATALLEIDTKQNPERTHSSSLSFTDGLLKKG